MRLKDVARMFNGMPCYDGYSSALLFSGQLGLYDDNKRDSETAERRVLSLTSTDAIPSRRVLLMAGSRFIVGHGNPDDFKGSTIRVGYVVHEATQLSQVRTLAEVCLNTAGFSAYAGRAWVKNMAFTEQGSKLVPEYHIHFASTEVVPDHSIVSFGSRLNLVRSSQAGPGGTLVCTVDEMPEPVIETGTVQAGTFNPLLGTMSGTPTAVRVVRVRWQSLFQYRSHLTTAFGPEDIQVAVAKASLTVTPGSIMTLSDGSYKVASVLSEGAVWLCRATRHV